MGTTLTLQQTVVYLPRWKPVKWTDNFSGFLEHLGCPYFAVVWVVVSVLLSSYPPPDDELLESRNTVWSSFHLLCQPLLSTWKMLIKYLVEQKKKLICETFKALYIEMYTSRKIIWFGTITHLSHVKANVFHLTNTFWTSTISRHYSWCWEYSNLKKNRLIFCPQRASILADGNS